MMLNLSYEITPEKLKGIKATENTLERYSKRNQEKVLLESTLSHASGILNDTG